MEQLTSRILQRSSDAIIVIRLADAVILDVNEAFSAITGHPEHELMGRPSRDLLLTLGPNGGPMSVGALRAIGSITDAPTGLWTRSGELRAGYLSALVVELDGQRDAVCAIRGMRDPTPEERRLAARVELTRILRSGGELPERTTRALEAYSKCLRWEFGAFWSADAGSRSLRCAAVWRAPVSDLEQLEQVSWRTAFEPGVGLLGRAWLSRKPAWVSDVSADPDFVRSRGGAVQPMRGWLGFPAWGPSGIVGVVEFISRETRQPDHELLRMIEEFGRLFGRLVEGVGVEGAGLPAEAGPRSPALHEAPSGSVLDALRDLVGAVAAVTEAVERHPVASARDEPPALPEELAAELGKLNRRLEDATDPHDHDSLPREPSPTAASAPAELQRRLPPGLTLKAVSERTGIPAATQRTWQRRYGFMHPRRSPSGYRLYGEEEIARIRKVKYLLGQGVRIGAAMAAVIGAADDIELAGTREPVASETESQPDKDDPDV